jgi:hypothetical protein
MVLVCTASEAGLVACRRDARYGGAASGERHRFQAAFFRHETHVPLQVSILPLPKFAPVTKPRRAARCT